MPTKPPAANADAPLLNPALRLLWRDPGRLQLGLDPNRAIVLAGLDPADRALIERLDGAHPLDELLGPEADHGCRPERVRELVALLERAGALDDGALPRTALDATNPLAPDLLAASLLSGRAAETFAARAGTRVEVYGAGRVGATLAALLSAAGVGEVTVEDDGGLRHVDLAPGGIRSRELAPPTRGEAARQVIEVVRQTRNRGQQPLPVQRSIVVLAPAGAVIPPEWLRQVRHRPHVAVLLRDTSAIIGPLVLPGDTPCLRCLELARADRDPAWPALTAQLVSSARAVEPADATLAAAAAALAAMHLLRWLDGPDTGVPIVAGTLELSLADLQLRRRTVAPHPGCGCGAIELSEPALL